MVALAGATATELQDHRVLVIGAVGTVLVASNGAYVAGDEVAGLLFDPSTEKFSLTGAPIVSRFGCTATLLLDGRVLLAGGHGGPNDEYLASAELYDPATGRFKPTGSMSEARADQTATLLPDGRVLIVGGDRQTRDGEDALTSSELYDPTTGRFSKTGSLTTARSGHTATLLGNGKLLIVGGTQDGDQFGNRFLSSAELYDPATGSFSRTGSMAVARYQHTATLLADGRVLVAGGLNGSSQFGLSSAEIYNPNTGKFTRTGTMSSARDGDTATRLLDGRVLVAGLDEGTSSTSGEIYDPAPGTFGPAGDIPASFGLDAATLLPDGQVLLIMEDMNSNGVDNPPLPVAAIYQP